MCVLFILQLTFEKKFLSDNWAPNISEKERREKLYSQAKYIKAGSFDGVYAI